MKGGSGGVRKFPSINTHKGLYQYKRLVFGIASAPAIWQRTMEQVLKDIPSTQCYLDDILVTGKNDEDHLQNLSTKDSVTMAYGRREKHASFSRVRYHIAATSLTDLVYINHKTKWKWNLWYYHKFLPNLASVLHPLNTLLQMGTKWE